MKQDETRDWVTRERVKTLCARAFLLDVNLLD